MRLEKLTSVAVLVALLAPLLNAPLVATAEENSYNVPVNQIEGGRQKSLSITPDGNTGAATFQIPIVTPPGRKGIEPTLNLSYNSNESDNTSIFGYGWNVALPSITRVNKEGANKLYSQNNFTSSIDGELILVTAGSPSVYRPRYDSGSFNKYTYNGNSWTLVAKDGTTYKFGTTAASRQDNPADSSRVYQWMMDDVRDTTNNFARYTYFKDSGQIYPDKSYYTGNTNTDGVFEVAFVREARTDKVPSWKTTFSVISNFRIKQIIIKKSSTWVRKYDLSYSAGVNGSRSLLSSVTESGRDEAGNITTLPATLLTYQQPSVGWQLNTGWTLPAPIINAFLTPENGVRFADVNGDGLPDEVQAEGDTSAYFCNNRLTGLNSGSAWLSGGPLVPNPSCFLGGVNPYKDDAGLRIGDINGDGKDDFVHAYDTDHLDDGAGENKTYKKVFVSSGSAISHDPVYAIPDGFGFSSWYLGSSPTNLIDVNADGRADLLNSGGVLDVKYAGDGTTYGWATSTVGAANTGPYVFDPRFADFNGDGFVDALEWHFQTANNVSFKKLALNKGEAGFIDSGIVPPGTMQYSSTAGDHGVRIGDLNGDGLPDLIKAFLGGAAGGPTAQEVYFNTGTGFTAGTFNLPPEAFFVSWNPTSGYKDYGWRLMDINGDLMPDLVSTYYPNGGNPQTSKVYINTGKRADILTSVTTPQGGTVAYTYKSSLLYKDASNNLLNTGAPFPVLTVDTVTITDGSGNSDSKSYTYEGISQFFNAYNDKAFAGFAKIVVTDSAGNATKTFYHQGNTTDSVNGEFADHPSKIGRPYRVARYNSAGNLLALEIQKWEHASLGTNRYLVTNTHSTSLAYDGDSTHRDHAVTRSFDATNGNTLSETDWGEVMATADGSFTDTGSDKRTMNFTYATDASNIVLNKISREQQLDQADTIVGETLRYYDDLTHGSVNVGNETKTEQLISGASYATTLRAYNGFGLVTSTTNPRGYTTNITYDAQNLYPASVINPLTHASTFQYNQIVGKVKRATDANGYVLETTYDPLGRVALLRGSDIAAPASLMTLQSTVYTDARNASSTYDRTFLTGTLSVDAYTYFDGLGRTVQNRLSGEDGQFSVVDTAYGHDNLKVSQSLPYFSAGGQKTAPSAPSALLTTVAYDGLNRPTANTNTSGTTTTAYADWMKTVTDPAGNSKAYAMDAFNNLKSVTEFLSGTPYTTTYSYDTRNNLTKLIDATGNERNFTYDLLNRRITAEDLHAPADASFGVWSYLYDANGNKTRDTKPDNTVINYTYDPLDRMQTEDAPSLAGTEIANSYDSGTYGIGRLTTSTKGTTTSNYAYTIRGDVLQEQRTIAATTFTTGYDYNRRGDVTTITHPDNSLTQYTFNPAGKVDRIQRKEASDSIYSDVVPNINYGPHSLPTFQSNANNTWSYFTYDPNELYRLRNISTIDPPASDPLTENVPIENQEALLQQELTADNSSSTVDVAPPEAEATTTTDPQLPVVTVEKQPIEKPVTIDVIAKPTTATQEAPPDGSAIIETVSAVVEAIKKSIAPEETESFASLDTLAPSGTTDELVKLRTVDSYTVRLSRDADGAETRVMRLFASPVHFKDPAGKLVPIDTRIKRGKRGFTLQNAPYSLDIAGSSTGEIARMTVGALSVTISPSTEKDIERSSDQSPKLFASVKRGILGTRTDNDEREIDQHAVFGDGIDVVLRADNSQVTKDVTIATREALAFLKQSDGFYEIPFLLSVPDATILSVDGAAVLAKPVETTGMAQLSLDKDAIYIRPTVVHDSNGEHTAITAVYAKSDTGFTLTKRIPVDWLADATYPVTTDAVLSYSPDVSDGTIGITASGWSATRNATTGTWMNTDQNAGPRTINSGGNWFGVDRNFYNFNTASLPDDAVVTAANLKLAYYSTNTESGQVVLTANTLTSPTTLQLSDHNNILDSELSARVGTNSLRLLQSGTYVPFALNPAGLAAVNKTGWTQLAARIVSDVTDTAPNGNYYANFYFSEATGTSLDPYLEVTYIVPTIPPTAADLKVEDTSNPTNVFDTTPEFSATFNDPDVIDSGAHYQIQVVADTGNFSAPLWDSGKIALSPTLSQGTRTPQISYGGVPLPQTNTKYFWRMKFWDDSGTVGPWSDGSDYFVLPASLPTQYDLHTNCLSAQTAQLDPAGLKCGAPVFAARYTIGAVGSTANKYRVQLATTADFSTDIVWDSGALGTSMPATAYGARTTDIIYRGNALAFNGTRYYWRIKFWDTNNNETGWSPVAQFTTFPSEVFQNLSFTYDLLGNIIAVKDGSDTNTKKDVAYTYDGLHRLTSATAVNTAAGGDYAHTYAYDILGNFTNKSDTGNYSYAETGKANPHAATTVGAATYIYDDNGNLLSDGTRTFTWNYDNTLASVTNGATTMTYGYDQNRQRISVTSGAITTKYPNKFYNTDGTKKTKHIFASDTMVATVETVGSVVTPYYHHADQLGSSTATSSQTVAFNKPPSITLIGDATVSVVKNSVYTDAGANASDQEDGNISNALSVSGTVNTAVLGSYFKTYSVTDSAGQTVQAIRTVTVIPPSSQMPTPEVRWELNGPQGSAGKVSNSGSSSGFGLTANGYTSVAGKGGAPNGAAQLNGSTDHFTAASFNPGTNNFTIGVRFKLNSASVYNQMIYEAVNPSNANEHIKIYVQPNNTVRCELNSQGATSYSVNVNDWRDVVCGRNGNGAFIYIDGAYHGNGTVYDPITSTSTAYIGKANQPPGQQQFTFNGMIDEIKFYNQALTWQQIPDVFAGLPNTPPTLTLTGPNPLYVSLGTVFTDPGATANDTESGDLTANIQTTGTVNTATLGTYTVTYSVTDGGGLKKKATRSITVAPPGQLVPTEVQSVDYFPYGGVRLDTRAGSFNEQRKFTGYEYDQSSDLSYANARYYNQNNGQFTSQDPVALSLGTSQAEQISGRTTKQLLSDPQGLNAYSYSRNNPLRYTDASGAWFKEFLTGQQSANDFQLEVGDATQYMGSGWQTAMDYSYAPAVIGSAPLLGYGAVVAGPQVMMGIRLGTLGQLPMLGRVDSMVNKGFDAINKATGLSKTEAVKLIQSTGKSLIDTRNSGNINTITTVGDKAIRMTTNPEATRIISSGVINPATKVVQYVSTGAMQPVSTITSIVQSVTRAITSFFK